MAQPGSALAWGARGRRFKSSRSDHSPKGPQAYISDIFFMTPKIVFILPSLTAGGAERVLITLMNGIDKTRFSPELLCVRAGGELQDILDTDIPYHTLNRYSVFRSVFALYQKLKELKPDVIVSTMAHMNFAVMVLKPFFPKTKFIIREAITPSFLLEKYKYRAFVIQSLYKHLYPKADMVLSPAQIILDEFEHVLGMQGNNFRLLPNSVDVEAMRSECCFERKADPCVKFIAAGRLHYQKGYDRLIEGFARRTMPFEWSLTIYGEGEERASLEALIALHGLEDNIFMPGLVSKPHQYFVKGDCFLLPSRYEGLPNVALEALACGLPVIATESSGGIKQIEQDADAGIVKIADTMDEFFIHLAAFQKRESDSESRSFLPDPYKREHAIASFEQILTTMI